MRIGQTQTQQQTLRLSPQFLQSITLMALPAAQLREHIFEELDKNPALELLRDPLTEPDFKSKKNGTKKETDAFQSFLESRAAPEKTLQEHLLDQVSLLKLTKDQSDLCAKIVQNLDERGFNREPPENLFFTAEQFDQTEKKLTAKQKKLLDFCLHTVRNLDPLGTACKDVQETLCFQAGLYNDTPQLALIILQQYFDLLQKPRAALIQKKLPQNPSIAEIENALDFIRSLNPLPARTFSATQILYALPDIIIHKKKQEDDTETAFSITVSGEQLPVIALSPSFTQMNGTMPKETLKFVNTALKDAKLFLHALSRRNTSLAKTAHALLFFQKNFFEKGAQFLRPLNLKDVALFVGLHEATVSRIIQGKFLQCEWGFFELKYFFTNAISSHSGEIQSKESVKFRIKNLIQENAAKGLNLSDSKIAQLLQTEGIPVARRTVAKYRTELQINSSFER